MKQAKERGRSNRESGREKKKQKGVLIKMKQEIDSLTSYLGPKYNKKLYTQNILHINKSILHIDKSQAM